MMRFGFNKDISFTPSLTDFDFPIIEKMDEFSMAKVSKL
jgi:hypothetical protein